MERRNLLIGLAAGAAGATLATTAAYAQATPAPATDAPAAPASATPATGLPPAPAMKTDMPIAGMSDAVKAHIKDTMTTGALSLAISRIALDKLKHPMGKQFAEFEVAEQNTVADILKGRMAPGTKPSGTVVPPTDASIEDALDADGKATLSKFREMAAGPALEKAYVAAEIEGHKKLLAVQTEYLKVADDADETNIAKLVKGMVDEHLALLGDIEKHLG